MQLSRHANERSQQRAIAPMMIDLLIQFGSSENAGAGVSKLFFNKASRRRVSAYAGPLAGLLNEHLDVYAIVSSDMKVITVGHRQDRITRH